ncbi:MAG: hypothetical protein HYV63_29495, partial [Candidatus Schekmanbacteria bacterium]|nr:hypothetical protein [Candidatus Schekmanbacteria bacterium]
PAAAKTAVAAAGELIGLARERRDQQRIDEVLRRLRALPIADMGCTAHERVARLLMDNGRASDGEEMLTDLVNAYAAPLGGADREQMTRLSALAHRLRMRAALATGNPAAAADAARAFLAGDPDDPDRDFALWHLAQALAAQGKAEEATRVYGQVSGAFAGQARAALGRLGR